MTEVDSAMADYDTLPLWLYVVEGLATFLFNSCLFFAIMTTQSLRSQKEFVIYGACILFDVVFGFTYFAAGVWRLSIYYQGYCEFSRFSDIGQFLALTDPAVTRWQCLLTPHTFLYLVITPGGGLTLIPRICSRNNCPSRLSGSLLWCLLPNELHATNH